MVDDTAPGDPERGPDDPEDDDADSVEEREDEGEEGEPGEDGDDGGEEETVEVAPEKPRSQRIREAAERAQELEKRKAELDARQREFDFRETQNRERQQQAERQKEDELLSGMTPQEQAMYTMAKRIVGVEKTVQQSSSQALDATDRAEFRRYEADPRFKKYAGEVERAYQQLRSQGTQISRVAVLDYLMGKALREKGEVAAAKQRKEGASRVASRRGAPASTRSNVAGNASRRTTLVDRAEREDWTI